MTLLLRVVSGAILLAVVAAALWIGTAALALLIGVAVLVAAWELTGLGRRLEAEPPLWLLAPLSLWLALRAVFPAGYRDADWPMYAAVVVGLTGCLLLRVDFRRWAVAVAGAIWVGFSIGTFLLIYQWRPADASHLGLRLVVLSVAGVIAGDTAAYLAGTALGRHRFFASISPKKSVEGAAAGLIACVAVTAAISQPLVAISPLLGAALGVLVSLAAQAGDLAESALKRRAGVKDSSGLIPGHGGLLDRLDSLVLVGPVVYCFLRLISY